mgnify:FL=1
MSGQAEESLEDQRICEGRPLPDPVPGVPIFGKARGKSVSRARAAGLDSTLSRRCRLTRLRVLNV